MRLPRYVYSCQPIYHLPTYLLSTYLSSLATHLSVYLFVYLSSLPTYLLI